MKKKNRKFLKRLNDDIQSDVLYYFLIQEKLNDYKKDPNVFSFDHLQFEIRSLNKMKNHRFDLTTLIKCINKYQIVTSLKNAIEEFIQRKNEDKEILWRCLRELSIGFSCHTFSKESLLI